MKGMFKKKGHGGDQEMSLNITAMADIMTILLVFLLKSFTSSAINIVPVSGLKLPAAGAQEQNFESLKIQIARSSITVEDAVVTTLDEFKVGKTDLFNNGTIRTLNQALEKERQRQLLIAKANSDVKVDSKVAIIADQFVPYSTIKAVLASAAVNGYTDFKLAVIRPE